MSSISSVIWDQQKEEELVSVLRNSSSRKKGCQCIAAKYGISCNAVERKLRRIIKTNPYLDKELSKGISRWSKTIQDETPPAKPEKSAIVPYTVESAILDVVKKKKDLPLEKEDIQAAAEKAGVHYHTALSTWGHMVANAKAFITSEPCGDRNCLWFKGDAFATMAKNDMAVSEVAKIFDVSISEVRKLIATCTRFPRKARVYQLPLEYYSTVKNQENPGEWLQRAVSEGWSTRELDAAVKGEPVCSVISVRKENEALKAKLAALQDEVDKSSTFSNDLRQQNQELREKMESIQAVSNMHASTFNDASNVVSLDRIQEMDGFIVPLAKAVAKLEGQLKAARKVSISAMEMLVRKNGRLNSHKKAVYDLQSIGITVADIRDQRTQVS